MIRRLFILPSAMSLLLCAATMVLWFDSRDALEELGYARWHRATSTDTIRGVGVGGSRGRVWVQYTYAEFYAPQTAASFRAAKAPGFHRVKVDLAPLRGLDAPTVRDWWRFRATRRSNSYVDLSSREAMAPAWFVMLLALIAPAAYLSLIAHNRLRKRLKLCQSCGYDLRASPDRCPECGTAIPHKTEVQA